MVAEKLRTLQYRTVLTCAMTPTIHPIKVMRITLDNVNVVRFRVGVVEWFGVAGLL